MRTQIINSKLVMRTQILNSKLVMRTQIIDDFHYNFPIIVPKKEECLRTINQLVACGLVEKLWSDFRNINHLNE